MGAGSCLNLSDSVPLIIAQCDIRCQIFNDNVTIGRNGSNIGGGGTDDLTISTNWMHLTKISHFCLSCYQLQCCIFLSVLLLYQRDSMFSVSSIDFL